MMDPPLPLTHAMAEPPIVSSSSISQPSRTRSKRKRESTDGDQGTDDLDRAPSSKRRATNLQVDVVQVPESFVRGAAPSPSTGDYTRHQALETPSTANSVKCQGPSSPVLVTSLKRKHDYEAKNAAEKARRELKDFQHTLPHGCFQLTGKTAFCNSDFMSLAHFRWYIMLLNDLDPHFFGKELNDFNPRTCTHLLLPACAEDWATCILKYFPALTHLAAPTNVLNVIFDVEADWGVGGKPKYLEAGAGLEVMVVPSFEGANDNPPAKAEAGVGLEVTVAPSLESTNDNPPLKASEGWLAVSKLTISAPLDVLVDGDVACLRKVTHLAFLLESEVKPTFMDQVKKLHTLDVCGTIIRDVEYYAAIEYLEKGTHLPARMDDKMIGYLRRRAFSHALKDRASCVVPLGDAGTWVEMANQWGRRVMCQDGDKDIWELAEGLTSILAGCAMKHLIFKTADDIQSFMRLWNNSRASNNKFTPIKAGKHWIPAPNQLVTRVHLSPVTDDVKGTEVMLSQMPEVQEIAVSAEKFTGLANGERAVLTQWKDLKVTILSPVATSGWPNVVDRKSTSTVTHLHLGDGATVQLIRLRDLLALTNAAMSAGVASSVLEGAGRTNRLLQSVVVLEQHDGSDGSSLSDPRVYYAGEDRFPERTRLEVPSVGGIGSLWTGTY